jgi:AcrR family transcriptional regulator
VSAKKSRRERDPEGTHELILAAAREVLAKDGGEGLSVAQVAELAGVNRSTAYQHFQTREQLIEATAACVSDRLCQAVFGDIEDNPSWESPTIESVADRFAQFAMENPELGCVWLFQLLTSQRPSSDRFFRLYLSHLEAFAKSEFAQPGIDAEVHAVTMLAATFLWPVWAQTRTHNAEERQEMAKRFAREMIRCSLQGICVKEKS